MHIVWELHLLFHVAPSRVPSLIGSPQHADYGSALREQLRKRDPQGDPEIERLVAKLDNLKKKVKLEDLPQIERTVLQLAKKPKEKVLWMRLLQRLAGWGLGVIEVLPPSLP